MQISYLKSTYLSLQLMIYFLALIILSPFPILLFFINFFIIFILIL